ncbi:SAM-dependent methyltransferase [Streptosporangium sp. NPDC048047]|uniref:SAM-dependent methyltransferase n=1 Tax=Streptosporangium sp. NPDC048047 TaxID=3155748 RepID=UPI003447676F
MNSGEPAPAVSAGAGHASPSIRLPDVTAPNNARIYDALAGGKDNLPSDRDVAEQLCRITPTLPAQIHGARAFLRRSVEQLTDMGVRQFLNLGCGLPISDNVHQVARRMAPQARVVYVDDDPMVASHGRAFLNTPDEGARFIKADVRQISGLLDQLEADFLDPGQPIAVLACNFLHFLPDVEAHRIVSALRTWLAPGSHLVISHFTSEWLQFVADDIVAVYRKAGLLIFPRSSSEIAAMYQGFQLSYEGIAPIRWDSDDAQGAHFAGGMGWPEEP